MYRGRCIGRLIEFLNEYCGVRYAYEVTFHAGYNYITFHSHPFAAFRWDVNTNIPTFKFIGDFQHFESRQEQLKGMTVQKFKEGETVHED